MDALIEAIDGACVHAVLQFHHWQVVMGGSDMWHRLRPRTCERYLCPPEVVKRLKREFAYVETNEVEGRRHVLEVIQQLLALRQTRGATIDDRYFARLERLQEQAIGVCFGDDLASETFLLSTQIVPDEPLIFEYSSVDHRSRVAPLVIRCATALGYEVIEEALPCT